MATKYNAKSDLQKLKSLNETTEQWARRVQKFLKSTTDVCLGASAAFVPNANATKELQTRLTTSAEFVGRSVENVQEVAQTRTAELAKGYQDVAKSRQKEHGFQELRRKLEYASVEVSTAILSTFQTQADHLDQLVRAAAEFQRHRLGRRHSLDSASTADSQETKKWTVSSDENNVELDWDAFDRDLAAVSNVVEKMGDQEETSAKVQKLKAELREARRENAELMKRTILAEQALASAQKETAELKEQLAIGCSSDDFSEVKRALQQEQLARLNAEQYLRDTREELKAAQFAFRVAKTVANRIADSAEIAKGSLVRYQSDVHCQHRHAERESSFRGTATPASEITSAKPESEIAVNRCDSAFRADDVPEETEPIPVSGGTVELDQSNPFQAPPSPAVATNPFLSDEPGSPASPPDHSSNPFLTPKEEKRMMNEQTDVPEWNPFVPESEANPFLTPVTSDPDSNPFLH